MSHATEFAVYGPDEQAKALTEVGMSLTGLEVDRAFWPGNELLPRLCKSA
ncbi:hypothetical protein [Streptomyces sp. SLBN-31]|nr:hypothetical protein [Streptomyces sp. SLBN-31]